MFKPFYLSFYSKAFYCDVAQNWRGYMLSLLFTVTLLHAVLYSISFHRAYQAFAANEASFWVSQMPNVSVVDGQFRMDKPWPAEIKNTQGTALVRFDTVYKEDHHVAGQVWITGNTIYIRPPYGDIHSFSVSGIKQQDVSRQTIQQLVDSPGQWFLLAIAGITLTLFIFYRLFQLLCFTLWGMLLNRMIGSFLSPQQIVRVCIAAMIPVLYLDAALLASGQGVWDWVSLSTVAISTVFGVFDPSLSWIAVKSALDPVGWPWTSFFLFTLYLIFALRANRSLLR